MRLSKHRVASLALVFVTVITTLYLHLPGQKKAIHGWRISNSIYLAALSMSRDPLLSLWLKKLCWQEILPNQVKQVISLDADVMFNRNIQDLWNIFNDFSDEQMIGGVFELTDYLRTHMTKLGYPTIKTGVNAGMLLLHLERIRHSNWSVTWRSVKREMHSKIGEVPFQDQGVLNTMIYRRPSLFHEIPCEWNIVAKLPFADNTYPVIWVVKHPDRADCVTGEKSRNQKLHLASLVHVAGTPKPETVFKSSKSGNYSPVIKYTAFTAAKFREVFMEVYSAFRTMDKGCFY
ncbi:unnamed protein product [Calicophoron daubneyi]|uniref:UDP-D-xylose:beta-D-glucoside alpha-1,3-D-xylosyltransferase n=1 Tax=Calicophoron daubneyi TaxID=300641 RepID=A0AAV2TC00_CALDB